MSKFIFEHDNPDLLKQMRYVILSNVNEDYPYYKCVIANSTYNNFECCFNKELDFLTSYWQGSEENIYIRGYYMTSDIVSYIRSSNKSSCTSGSYSQVNQDLEFTNVENNKNGLIDLIADTKFYSTATVSTDTNSGGTTAVDFSALTPYLLLISAILMLIFIKDFIKSCFYRRV